MKVHPKYIKCVKCWDVWNANMSIAFFIRQCLYCTFASFLVFIFTCGFHMMTEDPVALVIMPLTKGT